MEFGTPATRSSRRRNKGRSDDLVPSTPSNRGTMHTGGTTPVSNRTPISHKPTMCGDIASPATNNGQYSARLDHILSSTPGSLIVSPISANNAKSHTNNFSPWPYDDTVTITKINSPKIAKITPPAPVIGRITKVFESLPFAMNFNLEEKIGEGTFSTVYLASRKKSDIKIALKHLVPTSKPSKILMEANFMKAVSGHSNIIDLLGMWRIDGDIVLVMPFLKHARFPDLIFDMDLMEIKNYIGNLISALSHIHKLGIIHRDIKPNNFLYDRDKKKYALVDFGLAQYQTDIRTGESSRGRKRKPSGELRPDIDASRQKVDDDRTVLDNIQNKLSGSPTVRILRDSRVVRRSPRKQGGLLDDIKSPDKQDKNTTLSPAIDSRKPIGLSLVQNSGYFTPTTSLNSSITQISSHSQKTPNTSNLRISPRKRVSTELVVSPPILRQSPRKHPNSSLPRPTGFSQLRITGSSIVGSKSLSRTPSFTMLEPTSYTASQTSQATDQTFGRTPILRASMTSACSSLQMLPVAKPNTHQNKTISCECIGRARICEKCTAQPAMHAPRAGTPGFRPPEVLLKLTNQTTAIDMWAVGVVMISILSRSYPFFRAPDDMTALAELTVIFGSGEMKMLAKKYGRSLCVARESDPQDLDHLCKVLACRERRQKEGETPSKEQGDIKHFVTHEGIQILQDLLTIDQTYRISAEQALYHPFFKDADVHVQ